MGAVPFPRNCSTRQARRSRPRSQSAPLDWAGRGHRPRRESRLGRGGSSPGLRIVGVGGSAKTSGCMYRLSEQPLAWQAGDLKGCGRPRARCQGRLRRRRAPRASGSKAGAGTPRVFPCQGEWPWEPLSGPNVGPSTPAYSISSLPKHVLGRGNAGSAGAFRRGKSAVRSELGFGELTMGD